MYLVVPLLRLSVEDVISEFSRLAAAVGGLASRIGARTIRLGMLGSIFLSEDGLIASVHSWRSLLLRGL